MIKKHRLPTVAPGPVAAGLLAAALLLPELADAQAWDPIPRLDAGARSAVASGLDARAFRGLEDCLAAYPAASGARYFAAAVDVSDPSGSRDSSPLAATEYASAVARAWEGRMRDGDVVIVFAVANRAVAVDAGARWSRLGFAGEMVDLTLETSSYGDDARDGRYGAAICQLARDVEQTLAGLAPGAPNAAPEAAQRAPSKSAARPSPPQRDDAAGCAWPLLLLGALAGAVAFGWTKRRRASTARARAEAEVERWRLHLGDVADGLLQLESEHPLYFTATERWSGESLEADRRCARAVNRVYSLYSTAHELQQRAEAELATGGAWDSGPYDESWGLLNTEPVQLHGRDARRLSLGDDEGGEAVYDGPSAGLLEAIDAAHADALASLGAVTDIENAFYAASERAEEAAADATDAAERRSELGHSTAHLLARLDPALDERRRVQAELMGDPLTASARLDALAATLEDVARLGDAGNRIAETLRGATAETLGAVEERIADVRSRGFKLHEPGFDPDLQLDRGHRQSRDIEEALEAGDEERAITEHARLGRGLEELAQMIDASVDARTDVPGEVDDLAAALAELDGRLPASRRLLGELRDRYALDAFVGASDNLEELDPVRREIARGLDSIRDDHAAERYLAALEDLDTCRRLVQEGHALLDEIESVSDVLDAERRQALAGLEALVERQRTLREALDRTGVG
ncbi:MAG: hypothetical protein AAFX50_00815, partial [Acidobacteriota bacterium]